MKNTVESEENKTAALVLKLQEQQLSVRDRENCFEEGNETHTITMEELLAQPRVIL